MHALRAKAERGGAAGENTEGRTHDHVGWIVRIRLEASRADNGREGIGGYRRLQSVVALQHRGGREDSGGMSGRKRKLLTIGPRALRRVLEQVRGDTSHDLGFHHVDADLRYL